MFSHLVQIISVALDHRLAFVAGGERNQVIDFVILAHSFTLTSQRSDIIQMAFHGS